MKAERAFWMRMVVVALLLGGCDPAGGPEGPGWPEGKADDFSGLFPGTPPKRIILMIGDGMGVGAVTGAAYAKGEALEMLSMPELGFMTTHGHEFVTTDSAASASAIASGTKAVFGSLGVLPGTPEEREEEVDFQLHTIIDAAREAGWKTGLISTTSVIDATPAGFAAHRTSRKHKEDIALDVSEAEIDVLLGAGSKYFEGRADGKNLLSRMRNRDYSVARTASGLKRVAGYAERVAGLLHEKEMPSAASGERAMSLADLTGVALTVLDRENRDGFFLMVEGAQIDRRCHEASGPGTVDETLDFDLAVAAALAYARSRDDTLVIVTADHENGGLTILDPETAAPYLDTLGGEEGAAALASFPDYEWGPRPVEHVSLAAGTLRPEAADLRLTTLFNYLTLASRPSYTSNRRYFFAPHTPVMVALFAEGPGAAFVATTRDNADLGRRLKWLAKLDGEAAGEPVEPEDENKPRNVVLLLADGGGLSALTAATYVDGKLAATSMPRCGLLANRAADRLVPDRAGAATALSTGRTTVLGAVGLVPDGYDLVPAPTLLEQAEAAGKRTGLVSNVTLTDATLAAFYAHHDDPEDETLSATWLADFGTEAGDGMDVAFGGGRDHFDPDTLDALSERGVIVETTWSDEAAYPGEQLFRLVADDDLTPAADRLRYATEPTLEDMTWAALESLVDSPEGFVLVVHAGGLANALDRFERGQALVDEVVDFDRAVQAAQQFAWDHPDTLVVVTATRDSTLSLLDTHYPFYKGHCGIAQRCGGTERFVELPVAWQKVPNAEGLTDADLQGEFAPPGIILQYAWLPLRAAQDAPLPDPGSANFVPLFAYGPGAGSLRGFGTQAEAGSTLMGFVVR